MEENPLRKHSPHWCGGAAHLRPLSLGMELNGGRLIEHPLESELFTILSRRYGWEILPTVRVSKKEERFGK